MATGISFTLALVDRVTKPLRRVEKALHDVEKVMMKLPVETVQSRLDAALLPILTQLSANLMAGATVLKGWGDRFPLLSQLMSIMSVAALALVTALNQMKAAGAQLKGTLLSLIGLIGLCVMKVFSLKGNFSLLWAFAGYLVRSFRELKTIFLEVQQQIKKLVDGSFILNQVMTVLNKVSGFVGSVIAMVRTEIEALAQSMMDLVVNGVSAIIDKLGQMISQLKITESSGFKVVMTAIQNFSNLLAVSPIDMVNSMIISLRVEVESLCQSFINLVVNGISRIIDKLVGMVTQLKITESSGFKIIMTAIRNFSALLQVSPIDMVNRMIASLRAEVESLCQSFINLVVNGISRIIDKLVGMVTQLKITESSGFKIVMTAIQNFSNLLAISPIDMVNRMIASLRMNVEQLAKSLIQLAVDGISRIIDKLVGMVTQLKITESSGFKVIMTAIRNFSALLQISPIDMVNQMITSLRVQVEQLAKSLIQLAVNGISRIIDKLVGMVTQLKITESSGFKIIMTAIRNFSALLQMSPIDMVNRMIASLRMQVEQLAKSLIQLAVDGISKIIDKLVGMVTQLKITESGGFKVIMKAIRNFSALLQMSPLEMVNQMIVSLRVEVQQLAASLIQLALDGISKVIDRLGTMIDQLKIGESTGFKVMIAAILGLTAAIRECPIQDISLSLSSLADVLNRTSAASEEMAAIVEIMGSKTLTLAVDLVKKFSLSLVQCAMTGISSMITSIWGMTTALFACPITWVVLGIVALVAAIAGCVIYWDKLKGAIATVSEWFAKLAGWFTQMPGWAQALGVLFMPFITIPLAIVGHWDTIKQWFSSFWNKLSGWAQSWGVLFMPFITIPLAIVGHWDTVKQWFSNFWDNLGTMVNNMVDNIWNAIGGRLPKMLMEAWEGMKKWFFGLWDAIFAGLQPIMKKPEPIIEAIKMLLSGAKKLGGLVSGMVKKAFGFGGEEEVKKVPDKIPRSVPEAVTRHVPGASLSAPVRKLSEKVESEQELKGKSILVEDYREEGKAFAAKGSAKIQTLMAGKSGQEPTKQFGDINIKTEQPVDAATLRSILFLEGLG